MMLCHRGLPQNHYAEMSKRARTDEFDAQPETMAIASCQTDSVFFLDDGNIILLADSTLFLIHKSVLSMHSEIFRDMFSISSGINLRPPWFLC